jgi:hypothetical protein
MLIRRQRPLYCPQYEGVSPAAADVKYGGSLMTRVAQSVQCLATGWTTGRSRFDPRQRQKDFSSNPCVQTGSGVHPDSCTMGTGGPFPGSKSRPGRDADHSPLSIAEVENE